MSMKRVITYVIERVFPILLTVVFVAALLTVVFNDHSLNLANLVALVSGITSLYVSLLSLIVVLAHKRIEKRPYCGVRKNHLTLVPRLSLSIPLENPSGFPARLVKQKKVARLDAVPIELDEGVTRDTVVLPGESVNVFRVWLSPEETTAVANGEKTFDVEYTVEYEDIEQTARYQFHIEYRLNNNELGIVRSTAT